ncbi:hypothetical protein VTO42DRAFT_4921 [Malbranchea cinnamomea]
MDRTIDNNHNHVHQSGRVRRAIKRTFRWFKGEKECSTQGSREDTKLLGDSQKPALSFDPDGQPCHSLDADFERLSLTTVSTGHHNYNHRHPSFTSSYNDQEGADNPLTISQLWEFQRRSQEFQIDYVVDGNNSFVRRRRTSADDKMDEQEIQRLRKKVEMMRNEDMSMEEIGKWLCENYYGKDLKLGAIITTMDIRGEPKEYIAAEIMRRLNFDYIPEVQPRVHTAFSTAYARDAVLGVGDIRGGAYHNRKEEYPPKTGLLVPPQRHYVHNYGAPHQQATGFAQPLGPGTAVRSTNSSTLARPSEAPFSASPNMRRRAADGIPSPVQAMAPKYVSVASAPLHQPVPIHLKPIVPRWTDEVIEKTEALLAEEEARHALEPDPGELPILQPATLQRVRNGAPLPSNEPVDWSKQRRYFG